MKKVFTILLALFLVITCFGCNGQKTPDEKPAEPDKPEVVDSETAMNNFLAKLDKYNYVVESRDYAKLNVYSEDLVYFTHYPGSQLNVAFVTLKDETFHGYLDEDEMNDIDFYAPGKAVDAVIELLPNNWINIAEGNIWNIFYNNPNDPLEFTTNDAQVKTTLLTLSGTTTKALEVMEEVHMILDQGDPNTAHFTAAIGDMGMYHYDDLDLTISFGKATTDTRINKWLNNPVYPEKRTAWDVYDLSNFDAVFMRDYGEIAVPFPEFASYALIFDKNAYSERGEFEVYDAHATEKNVEDYINVLLNRGYEKVTLDNGNTAYRLMLREEKKASAELEVNYDNGFLMVGRMHYEIPVYEGIPALNEALVANGFVELKDTDIFEGWTARDTAVPRSEGWLYYFNYDMYITVQLTFEDHDAALAYLEEYGSRMKEIGYRESYAPNGASYENSNSFKSFNYLFNEEEDGLVQITFKNEKSLTPDEVNNMLKEHGLPEANVHGDIGARDQTTYNHNQSGFLGLKLLVYQPFDTLDEAYAYLDEYTARMEELGYDYINPQTVGSYRSYAYLNEELHKYVGFDVFEQNGHATVTLEFFSGENDSDALLGRIGK